MTGILDDDPVVTEWLGGLPAGGPPVRLPDAAELPDALLDLAVPHGEINAIVAAAARLDPALEPVIERSAWSILTGFGDIEPPKYRPPVPLVSAYPVFPLLAYLMVVPYTRAWQHERDIPADVTRRTLADIGRQVALYRRRRGGTGIENAWWPVRHLRGGLFQFGRLQFERAPLDADTGRAVAAAGGPDVPGGRRLDLHIPDFNGPLTPDACARSIDAAHVFFARYFPDETYAIAACHSWLLDPQLAGVLPEHSNIRAFQRLFRPGYPMAEPDDGEPLEFVFGTSAEPLDALPRDTSLQRALVDHLRAGGHWYGGNGWFPW